MNIGEEVVCVKSYEDEVVPAIKIGDVFKVTILSVCKCAHNNIAIGIGLKCKGPTEDICSCDICGSTDIIGGNEAIYDGRLFAPLSHLDFVLDEVHELLNPEVFQPCR